MTADGRASRYAQSLDDRGLVPAALRLEAALRDFIDAAMAGDDVRALETFVAAQALGVADVRVEAQLWAERTRLAARALPDGAGVVHGERLRSEFERGVA